MFRLMVSPSLTVAISVNALFPNLNRIQIEEYIITLSLPQPLLHQKRNFIFLWMLSTWRQRKLDYLPSWILKNYFCIHINCWIDTKAHAETVKSLFLHYSVKKKYRKITIFGTFSYARRTPDWIQLLSRSSWLVLATLSPAEWRPLPPSLVFSCTSYESKSTACKFPNKKANFFAVRAVSFMKTHTWKPIRH